MNSQIGEIAHNEQVRHLCHLRRDGGKLRVLRVRGNIEAGKHKIDPVVKGVGHPRNMKYDDRRPAAQFMHG
jgi:hypothetical protein